jgi:hypothetical protein
MWEVNYADYKENSRTNGVIIILQTQLEQLLVCIQ